MGVHEAFKLSFLSYSILLSYRTYYDEYKPQIINIIKVKYLKAVCKSVLFIILPYRLHKVQHIKKYKILIKQFDIKMTVKNQDLKLMKAIL